MSAQVEVFLKACARIDDEVTFGPNYQLVRKHAKTEQVKKSQVALSMQAFAIQADASSAATPRAKLQGAASLSRRGASYAHQLMREHRAAIETVKRNASRSRRRAERQQRKRRRRISCFSQAPLPG